MRANTNSIVLFESSDHAIKLDVELTDKTVWLTQAQLSKLFEKDQSVISRHISNAVKEGEVDRESNMQTVHIGSSDRPVTFYDLDVIISVGYRVKSQRGVEFRRWATDVLRRYVIDGHAETARSQATVQGLGSWITTNCASAAACNCEA